MSTPDLMIFEPNLGGHHAEFTCHLLHYWRDAAGGRRLVAAVAPGLLAEQPGLSAGAIHPPQVSESPLAGPLPGSVSSLWARGRCNLKLLTAAIERHRPKQVLVMYLDHVQLALATGLRFSFPVRISGILFHPTLHYQTEARRSLRGSLQRLRKRLVLRLISRNPHLGTVFTLDPSAVASLRGLGLDAVALPDPVIQTGYEQHPRAELRRRHGIKPGRKVLLLFGALTARKGVLPLLRAIALLPASAAREVTLLLAGPLDPALRAEVAQLTARAEAAGAQVAHHDAYILNGAVQAFMEASDLILAPYQRHFGSSAVLIRAALAERPVLSQDFGLMGAHVREHGLGLAVDTGGPAAIAAAIETFLKNPGAGYDPERARRFVQANTPELFCRTLHARLFPSRIELAVSASHL